MNSTSSPATVRHSRAARRCGAVVRPFSLVLLIAGFLVIAFQSRTDPRPPGRGPAKLSRSLVSPVKFSPPERRGLGLDSEAETVTASVVPAPSSTSLGVARNSRRDDEARRGPGIRLRAPPLI